jgi:hypothetical protein
MQRPEGLLRNRLRRMLPIQNEKGFPAMNITLHLLRIDTKAFATVAKTYPQSYSEDMSGSAVAPSEPKILDYSTLTVDDIDDDVLKSMVSWIREQERLALSLGKEKTTLQERVKAQEKCIGDLETELAFLQERNVEKQLQEMEALNTELSTQNKVLNEKYKAVKTHAKRLQDEKEALNQKLIKALERVSIATPSGVTSPTRPVAPTVTDRRPNGHIRPEVREIEQEVSDRRPDTSRASPRVGFGAGTMNTRTPPVPESVSSKRPPTVHQRLLAVAGSSGASVPKHKTALTEEAPPRKSKTALSEEPLRGRMTAKKCSYVSTTTGEPCTELIHHGSDYCDTHIKAIATRTCLYCAVCKDVPVGAPHSGPLSDVCPACHENHKRPPRPATAIWRVADWVAEFGGPDSKMCAQYLDQCAMQPVNWRALVELYCEEMGFTPEEMGYNIDANAAVQRGLITVLGGLGARRFQSSYTH